MKRFEEMSDLASDVTSMDVHEPVLDERVQGFSASTEKLKDHLFDEYMKQNLLEDFFVSMAGYLSDDEVDEARAAMVEFTDEDILSALSLPHELREKRFEMFESEIDNGKTVHEVISNFVKISSRHGFGVGYHCSAADLRPDEDDRWMIKGTEADHRDDDRMMAYYSSKFRHLYKKSHPKFVYIVRTDPSTHKTDGNWSRADSLSVISRIPFSDVEGYVQGTAKKILTSSHKHDEVS